jgi:hypothetical protein
VRKADVVSLGVVQYWKVVKRIGLTRKVSRVTGMRVTKELQERIRNWLKGYYLTTRMWQKNCFGCYLACAKIIAKFLGIYSARRVTMMEVTRGVGESGWK